MAKNPTRLADILSGSFDGEVRVWNLTRKATLFSILAHEGAVNGLSYAPDGDLFVSCGDDKIVRLWTLSELEKQEATSKASGGSPNVIVKLIKNSY